jgi:hypothetical protein
MTSRFIRPETTVLTLANGDTLVVKQRLNAGEQRARFTRIFLAGADGSRRVDPMQTGMALITAYLLDWSLTDDDGRPVKIAGLSVNELASVLDSLEPDSFGEIAAAIDAHETAQAAARETEKKTILSGSDASKAISSSPSVPVGGTSGLPN